MLSTPINISPVFYRMNKFCSFTLSLYNLVTINDSSHNDLYFDNGCLLKNSNCFKIAPWKPLHSSEILLVQRPSFIKGETEVLKSLWDRPGFFLADPGLQPTFPEPQTQPQLSAFSVSIPYWVDIGGEGRGDHRKITSHFSVFPTQVEQIAGTCLYPGLVWIA